jgi:glycerol uptake facilitator protein
VAEARSRVPWHRLPGLRRVGSVPALLIVNDANGSTFSGSTWASSLWRSRTIVIVTVYVFGYISGNHINPA